MKVGNRLLAIIIALLCGAVIVTLCCWQAWAEEVFIQYPEDAIQAQKEWREWKAEHHDTEWNDCREKCTFDGKLNEYCFDSCIDGVIDKQIAESEQKCHWLFHAEPFESVEAWSKKNPGWSPMGNPVCIEGSIHQWTHDSSKSRGYWKPIEPFVKAGCYVFFKKRKCR